MLNTVLPAYCRKFCSTTGALKNGRKSHIPLRKYRNVELLFSKRVICECQETNTSNVGYKDLQQPLPVLYQDFPKCCNTALSMSKVRYFLSLRSQIFLDCQVGCTLQSANFCISLNWWSGKPQPHKKPRKQFKDEAFICENNLWFLN